VTLPRGVHKVKARGREYFYFQADRGTKRAGPRIALPTDPQSPEFWSALRAAQGLAGVEQQVETFGQACDEFLKWPQLHVSVKASSIAKYRGSMKVARRAWEELPATGLRPKHVLELMDQLANKPGTANNVLGFLQALSKWGVPRGHFDQPLATGITPYETQEGHKPWTGAQQQFARLNMTGMLRRAYFLLRYTGQRGSDVVRLGETFIDDGGFRILQMKNGDKIGEIWCPIDPELADEMRSWSRETGPYLRQKYGKLVSRTYLDAAFAEFRDAHQELAGCTLHGLRATRVIELRQRGNTTLQIQDQVGMSAKMIDRYCRFADKKANGKAAVQMLRLRHKDDVR
jgi:hypothetical protein